MNNIEKSIYQKHAKIFTPRKDEIELLKEFDPEIFFRAIEPIGISQGRQARVSVLEYLGPGREGAEGSVVPDKYVIWKRLGEGRGLSHEEALELDSHLDGYVKKLKQSGWKIPPQLYRHIIHGESESRIFSYEKFIPGGDGDFLLKNPQEPKFRKWFFIRAAIEQLGGYDPRVLRKYTSGDEELTLLPEGIDFKPANLVLDDEEKLWLVDVFGPKELDSDGQWETYSSKLDDNISPEKLKLVCATREGLALRFLRLAENAWNVVNPQDLEELRQGIRLIINKSQFNDLEKKFIDAQVSTNYPWLNEIYSENQV